MNRILLLTTLSFFIYTIGFSQAISHVDFGSDGLKIDLNEEYALDVDSDGTIDFMINSYNNEMSFAPVVGIGCYVSQFDLTDWSSTDLVILEEGESTDGDRGSIYLSGEGPAEGWEDGQANYIGFAVFKSNGIDVSNGWMKMKVDADKEKLIILEYAYTEFTDDFEPSPIVVGNRGLDNVNDLSKVLSEVTFTNFYIR